MLVVILLFLSSPFASADPIRPDVVYDSDDQIELHQVKNSVSYFAARATVALFESASLRDEGNGTTTILGPTFGEAAELCPGERFFDQPSGSFCSGVLVAPDVVLTAGHCVEEGFCADTRFALGYSLDSPERDPRKLQTRELFACDKILSMRNEENGLDYALVKLKSVATARPLPLKREPMTKGQEITLAGFPMGMPLKVVEGAKVVWSGKTYANARLDSFVGSSGSPIVDARTGSLLAILVSGESDFIWDEKRACNMVKKCGARWCEGEYLIKVSAIANALQGR